MLKYVLSLSFSQDCCVFAMGASLYPFTLGSRRDKVRPAGNRIQVRWEPINQGIERRFSAALVDGVCGTDDSNRRPREREVLEGINSAVGSSAIWAFGDNAVGSSRLETCSCTLEGWVSVEVGEDSTHASQRRDAQIVFCLFFFLSLFIITFVYLPS